MQGLPYTTTAKGNGAIGVAYGGDSMWININGSREASNSSSDDNILYNEPLYASFKKGDSITIGRSSGDGPWLAILTEAY